MSKNKKIIFIVIIIGLLFLSLLAFGTMKKYNNPNKVVNIVFSTDEYYTEYTKVAIKSAIINKNFDSIYNIYVICVDMPITKEIEFRKLLDKNSHNVKISTIPLSLNDLKGLEKYEEKHDYVTKTDLFKFFFSDIFSELDKILYIDDDTLILKDLSELYNTDISNKYIAAVKKYDYDWDWVELYNGEKEIKKNYTYNCGVMLFNLKKWRKDNIKDKLIKAKNHDRTHYLVTQKSFNEVIPLKKIKQLSPIYNTFGRMIPQDYIVYNFRKIYKPYCDKMYTFDDFLENAVVIHYAGHRKPWSDENLIFAEKWWYYAKKINPNWHNSLE